MEHHSESTISNQYSLSIRIGSEGFSLSVEDDSNNIISTRKVSSLMSSLSTDEIIILISKETQLNYRHIHLIYESEVYSFVPAPVFQPNEAVDYLNIEQKTTKDDIILYNFLPAWDTVNIFTIPKTFQTALNQLFPNTIIEHHLSHFLTDKVKTQHENSIFIWLRPTIMDVIVFKNGRLHLLNSFGYQTTEDFTYHTLNIVDQLSIETEKCKVKLFNNEKKPEVKRLLEKYLIVN